MKPLLEKFRSHLAVEKGLAPPTLEAYTRDIERAMAPLGKRALDRITRADLLAVVTGLQEGGLSSRSISRMISSLRAFFRFLAAEGLIRSDPSELLRSPRGWSRPPHVLTQQQVEQLLNLPKGDHPLGIRDDAMIELLYAAGLRISELIKVRTRRVGSRRSVVRRRARAGAGKGVQRKNHPGWSDLSG